MAGVDGCTLGIRISNDTACCGSSSSPWPTPGCRPRPPPCLHRAGNVEGPITRVEQELALQHLWQRDIGGAWDAEKQVGMVEGAPHPTVHPKASHQLGEAHHAVGVGRGEQGARRPIFRLEGPMLQRLQQVAAPLDGGKGKSGPFSRPSCQAQRAVVAAACWEPTLAKPTPPQSKSRSTSLSALPTHRCALVEGGLHLLHRRKQDLGRGSEQAQRVPRSLRHPPLGQQVRSGIGILAHGRGHFLRSEGGRSGPDDRPECSRGCQCP